MVLVNQTIRAFLLSAMGLNANLEKNFSWMAFPGLIRAIVMLQCVVYVVVLLIPETLEYFVVTREGIANGEYWRLVSWVFCPFTIFSFGRSVLGAFFMFIILRISFLFSDSLENAWGEVRTSFYVYACLLCKALALYLGAIGILPQIDPQNYFFYLTIFFAFATIFPSFEFLLFFVLPVKIWILALISAAGLIFAGLSSGGHAIAYGISFFPYLVWATPRAWHWRRNQGQLAARRAKFTSQKKGAEAVTLHKCVVCGRTEVSNPELEFRVTPDEMEYCMDHLPEEYK